jgi:hypothetical protein
VKFYKYIDLTVGMLYFVRTWRLSQNFVHVAVSSGVYFLSSLYRAGILLLLDFFLDDFSQ